MVVAAGVGAIVALTAVPVAFEAHHPGWGAVAANVGGTLLLALSVLLALLAFQREGRADLVVEIARQIRDLRLNDEARKVRSVILRLEPAEWSPDARREILRYFGQMNHLAWLLEQVPEDVDKLTDPYWQNLLAEWEKARFLVKDDSRPWNTKGWYLHNLIGLIHHLRRRLRDGAAEAEQWEARWRDEFESQGPAGPRH